MEKRCIIDIGTNSIRMLRAVIEKGKIISSGKTLEMTRIGEGVDKTKLLSSAAMDRSISALKKFKKQALSEGIKDIKAIATSAVRDARNRDEFLKRAKLEIDIDIEIISGEKEAELGFIGVMGGIKKELGNVLVIDIGGGSTEFIVGNSRGIKYVKSLDVGAVRMTDKHITTDPISDKQLKALVYDVKNIINEIIEDLKEFRIDEVVGIGGTATNLASVAQQLEIYDSSKVHNYELSLEEINSMIYRFKSTDNNKRKKIKGLQPKRADIILAGSSILYEILAKLNTKSIRISEYDNLEGYLYFEYKN